MLNLVTTALKSPELSQPGVRRDVAKVREIPSMRRIQCALLVLRRGGQHTGTEERSPGAMGSSQLIASKLTVTLVLQPQGLSLPTT